MDGLKGGTSLSGTTGNLSLNPKRLNTQTSTRTAVPFQNSLLVTHVRSGTYLSDSYSSYCRGPHFTDSSSRSHWFNDRHSSSILKPIRPGLGDIKLLVHNLFRLLRVSFPEKTVLIIRYTEKKAVPKRMPQSSRLEGTCLAK